MIRFPRTLSFSLLLAFVAPAHAAGLPDTGQDTCYNDLAVDSVPASDPASIARDAGSHPRQDCRYGRDAAAATGALTKIGGGTRGFDYTKIANDGSVLGAGAVLGTAAGDWACTRDNITGLTWEVKTASGLRSNSNTYAWFSSDGSTNGGNAGAAGVNTCNGTLPGNNCNTEAYVSAVNAVRLCGATDWRMPALRELLTLVDADGSNPSIEPTYFPNTPASVFWSGTSYVPVSSKAWLVQFGSGYSGANEKALTGYHVRLVSGGQF